jgi:hypothetical protein
MPRDWEIPDDEEAVEEEDEFGPESSDWDLSEEHGYLWYPKREQWPVPSWLLVIVSVVVIVALVLPAVLLLFR